jgi:hypothetical protein
VTQWHSAIDMLMSMANRHRHPYEITGVTPKTRFGGDVINEKEKRCPWQLDLPKKPFKRVMGRGIPGYCKRRGNHRGEGRHIKIAQRPGNNLIHAVARKVTDMPGPGEASTSTQKAEGRLGKHPTEAADCTTTLQRIRPYSSQNVLRTKSAEN